jgi:hypothetical protein
MIKSIEIPKYKGDTSFFSFDDCCWWNDTWSEWIFLILGDTVEKTGVWFCLGHISRFININGSCKRRENLSVNCSFKSTFIVCKSFFNISVWQ